VTVRTHDISVRSRLLRVRSHEKWLSDVIRISKRAVLSFICSPMVALVSPMLVPGMPFRACDRYDLRPTQRFLNLGRETVHEALVFAAPLGTQRLWHLINMTEDALGRRKVFTNATKGFVFPD